jgi:hypothetical protein
VRHRRALAPCCATVADASGSAVIAQGNLEHLYQIRRALREREDHAECGV